MGKSGTLARVALVVYLGLTAALVVGVWVTPFLGGRALALARDVLGLLCHQSPESCLSIHGVAMPACARCAGIYSGMLCAVALHFAAGRRWSLGLIVLLSAAVLLAADVIAQAQGLYQSHVARLVTGAGLGTAAGSALLGWFNPRDEARTRTQREERAPESRGVVARKKSSGA